MSRSKLGFSVRRAHSKKLYCGRRCPLLRRLGLGLLLNLFRLRRRKDRSHRLSARQGRRLRQSEAKCKGGMRSTHVGARAGVPRQPAAASARAIKQRAPVLQDGLVPQLAGAADEADVRVLRAPVQDRPTRLFSAEGAALGSPCQRGCRTGPCSRPRRRAPPSCSAPSRTPESLGARGCSSRPPREWPRGRRPARPQSRWSRRSAGRARAL